MIEYRIETKAKLSKVKAIWKLFLQKDDKWHFTLEGTYIELRLTNYSQKIEKYLKEKEWKYTKFVYIDGIPITKKYQEQFEKIFHGFSELAMKLPRRKRIKGDDFYSCWERCIHLFANMSGVNLEDEANTLAWILVDRAFTAGVIRQYNKTLKDKKGKIY